VIPCILFLSMGVALFSTIASADEPFLRLPFGERAVLQPGQVVQGDYFAFGPHVEISGIVNGDLYAAGGQILVDGVVNGDVIAAGGKVILSGTVAQDARIAGGQVTITGTVGRNVTVGGGDIHLTETAKVHENLLVGGGNVHLAGHIGRDARVAAGNATLSGGIERDLAVASGSVQLTAKAVVGGKLRHWGEAAPSIDEKATVRGAITRRPLPEGWSLENARRGIVGIRVMAMVVNFLSTLILGLVILRLYPFFTHRVTATIRERPGASLGWGALALVAIPVAAISFFITLFALPIGVILLALYGPTVYLARVYAFTCLGQYLFPRRPDPSSLAWPFVAGLVLYSLLSLIPVVGGLLTLLTILFGLGALLMTKKELITTLREQNQV
jgi:cytoskeletal protein CcmA (bactofilin family)